MTPYGWEGNRWSGVALAMRHVTLVVDIPTGYDREEREWLTFNFNMQTRKTESDWFMECIHPPSVITHARIAADVGIAFSRVCLSAL